MSRTKSFMCEICGISFKETYALTKHKRNKHEGIKLHPCSFCSESFKDSDSKKAHERRHTGEKPYQCTECEKSFARRNSLRSHMRWHQDDLAFECNICHLRCDKLSRLRSHMISHTKERAFECDICHAKFARNASIRPHKLSVHNIVIPGKHELQGKCPEGARNTAQVSAAGSRQFECPICQKVLKSRKPYHIRRHMTIHNKEKEFDCHVCHKQFTQKSSLRAHVRKVHYQVAPPTGELSRALQLMYNNFDDGSSGSSRSSD